MAEGSGGPARIAGDVFAGAGLGLLLGTLVGLSGSPVVAGVVGGLTSLLAVFLGLNGEEGVAAKLPGVNAVRIGAFGFVTVLGLAIGLHARVNNSLADPPKDRLAAWSDAFKDDPTLAKQLAIYDITGIKPAAFTFGMPGQEETVENEGEGSDNNRTVLFSTFGDYDACSMLHPEEFDNPQFVLNRYRMDEAPDFLADIADEFEGMEGADLKEALSAAHKIICAVQAEDAKAK